MKKRVDELKVGDWVDLKKCSYLTPKRHAELATDIQDFQVLELERETENCICVYFDGLAIGFPVNYKVEVRNK